MVCGGNGHDSPCDSLCGGGGCGKCGGEGCNGAVTIAQKALKMAKLAEEKLRQKTSNATEVLIPQIREAKQDAMEAKVEAQSAHDEASKAKDMTDSTKVDVEALLKKIRDHLTNTDTATPEDIKKVAKEVLNMHIPMDPEKIKEVANKINEAVQSLTDIDKILNETAESRKIADELKKQAEDASLDAQNIRKTA